MKYRLSRLIPKIPIDDVLSKERNRLLIAAIVGIAITRSGLKFEEVNVLGAKFIIQNPEFIPEILTIILIYQLVSVGSKALFNYRLELLDERKSARISISDKAIYAGKAMLKIETLELKLSKHIEHFWKNQLTYSEEQNCWHHVEYLQNLKNEIKELPYTTLYEDIDELMINYVYMANENRINALEGPFKLAGSFHSYFEIYVPVLLGLTSLYYNLRAF